MKMVIVDDAPSVLFCMDLLFKGRGHDLSLFSDSSAALDNLAPDTDLVISDINMPGLTGFQIADEVALRLGPALPRTLLMSGNPDYRRDVATLPPSAVIGLVEKPFLPKTLCQVVGVLQETRSRCPGQVPPSMGVLPQPCKGPDSLGTQCSSRCLTAGYGLCPVYNSGPGLRLREHIEALQETGTPLLGVPSVA